MDCSTPGFPVHHQLPELAQTHVHWVIDAIQPSYPLLSPSPPAFDFSQVRVFSNHIRWPKYLSLSFKISPSSEYPGLIFFRIDWFDLLAVQRTLKSLLQHHSSKRKKKKKGNIQLLIIWPLLVFPPSLFTLLVTCSLLWFTNSVLAEVISPFPKWMYADVSGHSTDRGDPGLL